MIHARRALALISCSSSCQACTTIPLCTSSIASIRGNRMSRLDRCASSSALKIQARHLSQQQDKIRPRTISANSRGAPSTLDRNSILPFEVPVPKIIASYLDEYVIGQDRAKRALAVGVFNHYIRAASNRNTIEEEKVRIANGSRQRKLMERKIEEETSILSDYVGQSRGTKRWDEEGTSKISNAAKSSSTLSSDFFISLRPGEKKEANAQIFQSPTRRLPDQSKLADVAYPVKSKQKRSGSPIPAMDKSNIILIGPSGSGKTHLIRTLSTSLSIPFIHVDATPLTSAGYVGEDVESIMSRLLEAANWNVEEAERGIVCIDEIDKLASPTISSPSGTIKTAGRDVGGTGVQQALLRLLEGSIVSVPDKRAGSLPQGAALPKQASHGRTGENKPWWSPEMQLLNAEQGKSSSSAKSATTVAAIQGSQGDVVVEERSRGKLNPNSESVGMVRIDTSKILFVLSGAFVGLEDIVAARGGSTLNEAEPEDLTKFGLIPEFVGRLPVMVVLDELTEGDLCRILTEPKNALVSQYQTLFAAYNIKLHFTKPAIVSIARQAAQSSKSSSGARVLRRLMEKRLLDAMFDGPNGGAQYALMDRDAALGLSQVQLFSRGARSQWLNAIEEDEEKHRRRGLDKSNEGDYSKIKRATQIALTPPVKGIPRLKSSTLSTSLLARIDEATLRRRARARLTRPSRVGNLRIAADR